jgi:vitamin-K-epoxide reductase (warfarin-sensitive)
VQPAVNNAAVPPFEHINRRGQIAFVLIAILSLSGIIVSAISLQRHYAKSATQFCELGEKFSCDIVNRSEYSSVIGIPVAGIGIVGYALLLMLSTVRRAHAETPNQLLGAAFTGFTFALYLTYIEARVLETWCILCLISLALISLVSVLAVFVKLRSR